MNKVFRREGPQRNSCKIQRRRYHTKRRRDGNMENGFQHGHHGECCRGGRGSTAAYGIRGGVGSWRAGTKIC
jgi:hypothetical protein